MPCDISICFLFLNLLLLFLKAEEAARESRQMKQDHYAEMRRKKDEEREAQEQLLVGHDCFACNSVLASSFWWCQGKCLCFLIGSVATYKIAIIGRRS